MFLLFRKKSFSEKNLLAQRIAFQTVYTNCWYLNFGRNGALQSKRVPTYKVTSRSPIRSTKTVASNGMYIFNTVRPFKILINRN